MPSLRRVLWVCLLVALGAAPGSLGAGPSAKSTVSADTALKIKGPFVSKPVSPASFDGDVRDLPMAGMDEEVEEREVNPRRGAAPIPPKAGAPWHDPLWVENPQAAAPLSGALSAPILNFDGGKTSALPHDPVGDVGPNHYVQALNSSFNVYDKFGVKTAGPIALNSLFAPLGGVCASGIGDPIVMYDPLADRWIIAQLASGGNSECVAVSKTPSPTGAYWLYQLNVGNFPDFPKLAVWPDAYYISASFGNQVLAAAFDRANMLTGAPAAVVKFTTASLPGLDFNILLPADVDGSVPPPAGAPASFYRQHDGNSFGGVDRLELWAFHVDWTTTTNSTFTGPTSIPLASFDSALCGFVSLSCAPQPLTTVKLDPLNEVPQWRFSYRNFGSHETLLGSFTVDVNNADGHGIRWFELRRTGGGAWTLHQEGTHAPQDGGAFEHRWMSSIAMDKQGNIALGYAISASSGVYPGLRYSGRLVSDPLGTMPRGEEALKAGETFTTSNRWGDYSALVVDPSDDCTFWYTGDYVKASDGRQTRIGTFKFSTCTEPVCGNNATEPPETCDDGDTDGGDGCAADCTLEQFCGNGAVQSPETCDPPGPPYDCPASCTCCMTHAGPGCGNATCEALVCSHSPSCCSTSWSFACVAAANLLAACTDCCAPAAPSNCCEAHAAGGCTDPSCQSAVCAADSACCDTAWDAGCAAAAVQRPECQDDCCTAFLCREDCTSCGDGVLDPPTEECDGALAATSDCCSVQPGPGCSNAVCQAQVCALDPQCCNLAWDATCAASAATLDCCQGPTCRAGDCCIDTDSDGACDTADSCPLTPNVQGTSNCCAPRGGPGCDNAGCQAGVCAVDPSCCSTAWDATCAAEATTEVFCRNACGGAAFAEALLAPDTTSFGWIAPADVAWARGDLANVAVYQEDAFVLAPLATSIPAPEVPEPGAALWWLVRPDCPAGSWTSGGATECGVTATCPDGPRDANLP